MHRRLFRLLSAMFVIASLSISAHASDFPAFSPIPARALIGDGPHRLSDVRPISHNAAGCMSIEGHASAYSGHARHKQKLSTRLEPLGTNMSLDTAG